MLPFIFVSIGDYKTSIDSVYSKKWILKDQEVVFEKNIQYSEDRKPIRIIQYRKEYLKSTCIQSCYIADYDCYILIHGNCYLTDSQIQQYEGEHLNYAADLYRRGGTNAFKGLRGEHAIVFVYPQKRKVICITSYFGFIPLYYLHSDAGIIISSSLSLVGELSSDELNNAVVAQICLYNYPISDYSLLRNVQITPGASELIYKDGKLNLMSYWSPVDFLQRDCYNRKKSEEIVDNALERSIRFFSSNSDRCCLSLTGGWDGRLVLSYLLKHKNADQILLYSFGTEESLDVTIPHHIAENLRLSYQAFILDEDYLKHHYIKAAVCTALFSEGCRGIQKAHYYHAMERLSEHSEAIISGNCGSNLMKGIATKPSVVFNRYIIDIMEAKDIESTLAEHCKQLKDRSGDIFNELHVDDFTESIVNGLMKNILTIQDYTERFSTFLLSFTERKYFGPETVSYGHLVSNYSPFIDFDFLDSLSQTVFYNARKKSSSLLSNWNNSKLYGRLIRENNYQLASFMSDKGVKITDLADPYSYPRLVFKKLLKEKPRKKRVADPYNTDKVLDLFLDILPHPSSAIRDLSKKEKRLTEGYLTALYWFEHRDIFLQGKII